MCPPHLFSNNFNNIDRVLHIFTPIYASLCLLSMPPLYVPLPPCAGNNNSKSLVRFEFVEIIIRIAMAMYCAGGSCGGRIERQAETNAEAERGRERQRETERDRERQGETGRDRDRGWRSRVER